MDALISIRAGEFCIPLMDDLQMVEKMYYEQSEMICTYL